MNPTRLAAHLLLGLSLSLPWAASARGQSAPPAAAHAESPAGTRAQTESHGDPALLRMQIEAVVRQMALAAASGDGKAFLDLIDRADPVFVREKQNWAADLATHQPAALEISVIGDVTSSPQIPHDARATLRWSWRMEDWPSHRQVEFPARFVRGESGWLYAGEAWLRHEAQGVVVFYLTPREQELAARIAQELPAVRAHVHEGLGYAPDSDLARRVQEVKVYDTMAHLQQSIYLSYPDALGGWNEPGESIKLLGSEGSSTKMVRALLAHEYGHVASFEMGEPINDAPWWVLEGVAELAAQRYAGSWTGVDRTVRGWAKAGLLSDWALLADFRGEARNHVDRVYTQGHHMVGYVSSLAGRDGRNAWLRAMARGLSLDEATREALGMSFEELDRRWRESLLTPAPRRERQPDAEPEPEPEPAGAQP